jgi:glycosyltransferase involved in cell wall biosynthesis
MKKILWLPSWYPTQLDPFRGDFIQRHALAASRYHLIHVIFVEKKPQNTGIGISYEKKNTGNLTEEIIYNPSSSIFIIGKLFSLVNYFLLNRRYIKAYIKANGLPDYVHVHVPIKAGLIALWIKWRYKIPYLLTEHYGIYNNVSPMPFRKRSLAFRYFSKQIIRRAAVFLPVSNKIALDIGLQAVKRNYTVITNTVDTALFHYTPAPLSKFIFLHVSNMVPIKNVPGIVRSFAELWRVRQDMELWLTGPVPEEISLLINSSGAYNKGVILKGEVSYAEVAEQMQLAHCILLFSCTENMPCVLLEAFCCGRPVIATRVGGIPEVVNTNNGILVSSEDEKGLYEAMNSMMNNYHYYNLASISKKATDLYSYEAIGKQIGKMYENN